jgi:catechol 2,3-dioxygenase-like lactoylglutathione lyase family enzyme
MKHLNLLVLRSADMEKTRRFYELLGHQFLRHAHGSGPEHFAHEDDRGILEIYPVKAGEKPDNVGLGFAGTDLEAIRERVGEFQPGPIRDNEWGRTFVVRDPDGRRVEIKQA